MVLSSTLVRKDFKASIDLEDVLEKKIMFWRKIYYREKENRRISPNTAPHHKKHLGSAGYPISIMRPTFTLIDQSDPIYIRTYRMIVRGILDYSVSLMKILMKASGKSLGYRLVDNGDIRSIDDLVDIFFRQRIGLLDIVDESINVMRINLYECMSCYGTRYIGVSLCDFEAGVIEGVLERLYGKNTTIEKYCWGLGYHFCGFESYFE